MQHAIERAITKVEGSTLNLNEFFLLHFLSLADHHRLMQNELEDKLHLSASAISRMIAKLEAKNCGVITKAASPTDKRAAYIQLTPYGESLLERICQEVEKALAKYDRYL